VKKGSFTWWIRIW